MKRQRGGTLHFLLWVIIFTAIILGIFQAASGSDTFRIAVCAVEKALADHVAPRAAPPTYCRA